MNRVFYVKNCWICKDEVFATLMANTELPIGEKIIPTDATSKDPSCKFLDNIYGGERRVPTLVLSNLGMIERFGIRKGEIDHTLKISTLDWVHSLTFIKSIKNIL
ncbi:MAG: hypothetical protein ACE5J4_02270 [Candidatus Aenigmatarchaeota archaeon]